METLSTHSATGVTAQPGEKSRLQAAALTCAMKKGAFIVVLERNWIVAFMAMALPGVADKICQTPGITRLRLCQQQRQRQMKIITGSSKVVQGTGETQIDSWSTVLL